MAKLDNIKETFEKIGSQFILPIEKFPEKLSEIKAIIFDWDGVFHSGYKNESGSSSFSETDSMGINMLRFGLYLKHGKIPFSSIITGENNLTALHWGEREHLNAIFLSVKDKAQLLPYLMETYNLNPSEILFVFDDILDLSLAKSCGLRFMVKKKANPFLIEYCIQNGLTDYVTACEGNEHALREISEVCLTILGVFNETVYERMRFSDKYKPYIEKRQTIQTNSFSFKTGTLNQLK